MSGRLTNEEAARLSEEIAGLTASGLPLAPGLRATAEELPPGRLRSTLGALAGALDGGATLEEAIARQGRRLPEHLRGIIEVGARTGKMSQALGRFVGFMSVGTDLGRRLWLNLAYPAVALAAAMVVFAFVCTAIVSSFERIFRDFGVPLPGLTVALIAISRVFNVGWRALLEGVIGFTLFAVFARALIPASTRRSMLSSIPVAGAVWRNAALAEFCHLLGLMLECEIPLVEALRLTGVGVPDDTIHRACRSMVRDVEQGLSLAESVARHSIFPRGLHRVMTWAEGHQSLPQSLHMLGEMFEARAQAQASFAGSVLSVITVLAILFGVAVMVIGLFLPLIFLISKLAG